MQLTPKRRLRLFIGICMAGSLAALAGLYAWGIQSQPAYRSKRVQAQSDALARQFEDMPQWLVTDDHDSRG